MKLDRIEAFGINHSYVELCSINYCIISSFVAFVVRALVLGGFEKEILTATRTGIFVFGFYLDEVPHQTISMEGMWTLLVGSPHYRLAFVIFLDTDCAKIRHRFLVALDITNTIGFIRG